MIKSGGKKTMVSGKVAIASIALGFFLDLIYEALTNPRFDLSKWLEWCENLFGTDDDDGSLSEPEQNVPTRQSGEVPRSESSFEKLGLTPFALLAQMLHRSIADPSVFPRFDSSLRMDLVLERDTELHKDSVMDALNLNGYQVDELIRSIGVLILRDQAGIIASYQELEKEDAKSE